MIVQDGSTLTQNGAQTDGGPIEDRVLKNVRALEAWYAAELERRLAALTEILNAQLQAQVQVLREEYERHVKALQERAREQQAQKPVHANASVPGLDALLEEIRKVEGVAQKCASELERMVADDTVNLGLLLQMRNQQLEVRAYLRGLKFSVEGAPSLAAPEFGRELA